jgi:hypothetical protein
MDGATSRCEEDGWAQSRANIERTGGGRSMCCLSP